MRKGKGSYAISCEYHGISRWRLDFEKIHLRWAGHIACARVDGIARQNEKLRSYHGRPRPPGWDLDPLGTL